MTRMVHLVIFMWSDSTYSVFEEKTNCFVKQYDAYNDTEYGEVSFKIYFC